jgi:hypothetical protein
VEIDSHLGGRWCNNTLERRFIPSGMHIYLCLVTLNEQHKKGEFAPEYRADHAKASNFE